MGQFITGEAARERFRELFDQVDAVHDEMRALSSDGVGNEFRVQMAERLETQERVNRGLMYRIFGEIADPPDEAGMLPTVDRQVGGAVADRTQGDQAPHEGGRAHPAAAPADRPAAATTSYRGWHKPSKRRDR